jgi:uncharacterized membrane-anchored protein YjiN (DUF445 family)
MPTRKPVPVKKKPRTKLSPTNQEKMQELLERFDGVSEKLAHYSQLSSEIKAEIEALVKTLDGADYKWEDDGHSVAYVRAHTTEIDPDKVKDYVTSAVWRRVAKYTVDKDKFEREVVEGNIDDEIVENAITVKPKKPYVKVTRK